MPIIFGAVSHMDLMSLKIWEGKVITLNMKVRYVKVSFMLFMYD